MWHNLWKDEKSFVMQINRVDSCQKILYVMCGQLSKVMC
mgnify:CR=1 FL=1